MASKGVLIKILTHHWKRLANTEKDHFIPGFDFDLDEVWMPLSPHLRSVQQRNHLGGVDSSSSASSTSSIYAGNRKPEVGKDGWSKTNEDIHDTVFFRKSTDNDSNQQSKSDDSELFQHLKKFLKSGQILANFRSKKCREQTRKSHNLFFWIFVHSHLKLIFLQFQNSKSK